MRSSRCAVLWILLLSLAVSAATPQQRTRTQSAASSPAPGADVFVRILQREDSRWIGSDGLLADLARSPSAAVKMRALLALGRIGDPQGLPWLFDRLADPSPLVRARALFAIGEIVDRRNLEHEGYELRSEWLAPVDRRLSDRNAQVRARAVEALGKSADRSYADRIIAVIMKPAEPVDVVSQGLVALVRMGDPLSLERILPLHKHSSAEVRWLLADAVFRLRNPTAARQLKPLLADAGAQVRAHAAQAYGQTGLAAVAPLASLLKDPSLKVRIGAARGLGLTASRPAAAPLVEFIRGHLSAPAGEEEAAVIAAVEAWGDLAPEGGSEVISRLARQLRPAAAAAWVALGKARRGDERFAGEIELGSQPLWLQRFQIQALGENGARAALEKLLSFCTGAPGEQRRLIPWCLDAVIRTGQPIHPETFWRYLSDPDPFLRAHAIQALAELSRRAAGRGPWIGEATERIMRSYFDYQSEAVAEARLAAADFLSTLDAAGAAARLQRIARDPDRSVRLRARNLLRSRFGEVPPGIAGMVNTGRNYAFYANAMNTVKRYSGARFLTERGNWSIRFVGDDAPLTIYNFITLAERGFFNQLTFSRMVPDFVLQGGDPRNDTDGGPGYTLRCEINEQPFLRGTVGMALAGKDSGGSQYFICLSPQPYLDGGYTAFAQVSDGIEVIDRIGMGDRVEAIELIPRGASRAASPIESSERKASAVSGRGAQ